MAQSYEPFNKLSRSVSVIGVGCTPFVQMTEDPTYAGLTEGELFGYAALEACEDAGINPSDIELYFHGAALPMQASDYLTPAVQVKNWFGQPNIASAHHS